MNTAMARRLALGDRVIWTGKDDCQPSGPGTIIRITAHQVEVLWEGKTARRYRRAQLHNLRHESDGVLPHMPLRLRKSHLYGVCVATQAGEHDRHIVMT